jgi:hypothetical protein
MSFEERQALWFDILKLPSPALQKIVNIVYEEEPQHLEKVIPNKAKFVWVEE